VIVVGVSVILEALLRTPAAREKKNGSSTRATLHAPHLLGVEVAQVIRRYVANGEIDSDRGRAALADWFGRENTIKTCLIPAN